MANEKIRLPSLSSLQTAVIIFLATAALIAFPFAGHLITAGVLCFLFGYLFSFFRSEPNRRFQERIFQEMLREQAKTAQALVENLPIAMIIGNKHGPIACSIPALRLFGAVSAEDFFENYLQHYNNLEAHWEGCSQQLSQVSEPLRSCLDGEGSTRRMNIRSLENPSETKTIDVLSSPLRTVTNSELGAVIFDDITERMRSENELSAVYRREHQIAETLQQSILLVENNLQATGFDFHACYRPAVSEAAIGGDFFDAFPINKNLVAFTIGDVSGKGLVAAARTAETKYTLRAFLREYPSPSLALVRLNEYLCERQRSPETEIEGFICLTIIVANSKTGQVSISSAGFEPPIIVQEDFETYSMPVEGSLPVGIMPGQQYQKKTIQLAENDVLILATDGVTEAKGKSDLFGTERFIKSSDQARSMDSLEQATKLILNDAAAFAGGNLHDDACIIAMRRMPLAKPPRSRHRADREAA